jgi:hypothetical protein
MPDINKVSKPSLHILFYVFIFTFKLDGASWQQDLSNNYFNNSNSNEKMSLYDIVSKKNHQIIIYAFACIIISQLIQIPFKIRRINC